MRISNFRRFTLADYPELPEGFEKFFSQLNLILEELVQALQGNTSVGENLNGARLDVQVEHGKAQDFTLKEKIRGKPAIGFAYAPGYKTESTVSFPDPENVRVQLDFASPVPTGKVAATVLVLGE
jgi:hypothetical protein